MTSTALRTLSILACSASALVACTTPRPDESSPYSLRVRIDNAAGDSLPSNLRYAAVWATLRGKEKGFVTTADGPITSVTDPFSIALTLPDVATRLAATPVEFTSITNSVTARSYRPRIVIYGDEDGDGHFGPSVLGGTGPDSIVAIDSPFDVSISALLDLPGVLSSLTPAETEAFYEATNGRYTPFVWTLEAGSGRVIVPQQAALKIPISSAVLPSTDLDCFRQTSNPSLGGNTGVPSSRAIIDTGLDAAAICGATITDCRSADLGALPPPSLEPHVTGNPLRILQCQHNDFFEFLLIAESNRTCHGCNCSADIVLTLYATTAALRPSWWPCGSQIPYCHSTMPATTIDVKCLSRSTDGGAPDAAVLSRDAGPG